MKQILFNFFMGFLVVRTAMSFGFDFTDYKLWAIVIALSYSYYMLTYDNTTSDKRN